MLPVDEKPQRTELPLPIKNGSCNLHVETIASILMECKYIEDLDMGTTLRVSREGDKVFKFLAQKHLQLNLKCLRISDSSFGMVCGPLAVLNFSAFEWNNVTMARQRQLQSLLSVRPHLKVDIFASDCF
jgi:hypothetical protein